jgi:hypothetical protein
MMMNASTVAAATGYRRRHKKSSRSIRLTAKTNSIPTTII